MERLEKIDWSLLQAYVAVAEAGSLSSAAQVLGVSQPTIGRQVKSIEEQLGMTLFYRQPRGLSLTDEGQNLLPHATAMAQAASAFATVAAGHDMSAQGSVRITVSEFVGHYFLPPIITQLRRDHPNIQIELHLTDQTENLLFREADIAIRMFRPTQLEVVTKRLGVMELGFAAAKSYLDVRGRPKKIEDLFDHDLLGDDRSESYINVAGKFGWVLTRSDFSFRSDNRNLHCEMIKEGAGIGVMSTKLTETWPEVERVVEDFPVPGLGIWLASHEVIRQTPRVATVWSALEVGLKPWLNPATGVPLLSDY